MSSSSKQNSHVIWSERVDKALSRVPVYIRDKFLAWARLVEELGVRHARKYKGFHDEPLKGSRAGQRSVRLNRAYRAIYIENTSGEVEIVEVIEVTKHDY